MSTASISRRGCYVEVQPTSGVESHWKARSAEHDSMHTPFPFRTITQTQVIHLLTIKKLVSYKGAYLSRRLVQIANALLAGGSGGGLKLPSHHRVPTALDRGGDNTGDWIDKLQMMIVE